VITDLFEGKIARPEHGRPARPARPGSLAARPALAGAGPGGTAARPALAGAGPGGTAARPALAGQAETAAARATFPDWRFSPNIGGRPEVYELENRAVDGAGHVLAAIRGLAPWQDRTLIDLGCGTGYWLARYAGQAREIIGVEPDPVLRAAAATRARGLPGTTVRAGSAERLPLASCSADVVHARFAYFLSPGGDAGLAEVLRVLRPGGSLVVVDNDYRWGDFAGLLAAGSANAPQRTAATIDAWWRGRGAVRTEVHSELRFASRADLAAVLEIELPAAVARSWLARNPAATGLTYGYVLFAVSRPTSGWLRASQSRPGPRSTEAGHGPG
jgi:SAM-dependent methyltransferase